MSAKPPLVPATRERAKAGGWRLTITCPICGKVHTHGGDYGHRVAHCGNGPGIDQDKVTRGYYLVPKDRVCQLCGEPMGKFACESCDDWTEEEGSRS